MKLNKITIFVLKSMFLSTALLAAEVTPPRYLVDMEPIPYFLSVDGAWGNSSGLSSPANSRVDALPIPVILGERHMVLLGGGYMQEMYHTFDEIFRGAYGSFFATGNIGEKFYYQTYQSTGVFSGGSLAPGASLSTDMPWKYFQFSFVGYKWSPRLATDIGLMSISNFGTPVFIPLLQMTFSRRPFVFDLSLPLSTGLRFKVHERLHLLATTSLKSSSYLFENARIQFSMVCTRTQMEVNLARWTWAKLGVEYETLAEALYRGTAANLPDGWKLNVGIEMRI